LFSFHDHPDELFIADSECAFIDSLASEKLVRRERLALPPPNRPSGIHKLRWHLTQLLRR
jgi:hypothetical protein